MGTGVLVLGSWFLVIGVMYLMLIGIFTIGWFRRELAVDSSSWQLKVGVVIAAKNEEKYIGDLMNDLLLQDYQENLMEIIVVDDQSTDGTVNIINDFIGRNRTNRCILIKNEDYNGSGKKDAISLGVAHATGEIVLCTDADCRVGSGWISAMASYFRDEKIKMVLGPVKYVEGKTLSDHFQALEFAGLMASGAGAALAGLPFMCSGANLAYRKEAFSKVNGFEGNEKFLSGDDVFLLHKINKTFGRKAVHFCKDKKAVVGTYPAKGLWKFISQRVRWASKSKGYRDITAVWTAIIVFSFNLLLILSLLAGFINPGFFVLSAGFFLLKILTDLPLIWGFTGFTNQRKLMLWYLPFQVVYPVYVVVAGVLSLLKRKRW
jgi:cellulose synthase/poly-beta-1,6-N-acetylglucosamine synthase-like glycosyltransferase